MSYLTIDSTQRTAFSIESSIYFMLPILAKLNSYCFILLLNVVVLLLSILTLINRACRVIDNVIEYTLTHYTSDLQRSFICNCNLLMHLFIYWLYIRLHIKTQFFNSHEGSMYLFSLSLSPSCTIENLSAFIELIWQENLREAAQTNCPEISTVCSGCWNRSALDSY